MKIEISLYPDLGNKSLKCVPSFTLALQLGASLVYKP